MYSNQLVPKQPSLYRSMPSANPSGIQAGSYPKLTVGSYMNPFLAYPPVVPSICPCRFI